MLNRYDKIQESRTASVVKITDLLKKRIYLYENEPAHFMSTIFHFIFRRGRFCWLRKPVRYHKYEMAVQ